MSYTEIGYRVVDCLEAFPDGQSMDEQWETSDDDGLGRGSRPDWISIDVLSKKKNTRLIDCYSFIHLSTESTETRLKTVTFYTYYVQYVQKES